jgi:hypothetical protein
LFTKRRIHRNHKAKVKITKEEIQTTLENRRKIPTKSLKRALKRKNRDEEGGTS